MLWSSPQESRYLGLLAHKWIPTKPITVHHGPTLASLVLQAAQDQERLPWLWKLSHHWTSHGWSFCPWYELLCTPHEELRVDGVPQDSFYKPLSPAQHDAAHRNEYDFDSPNAIDYDLLFERLEDLKAGCVVQNYFHISCIKHTAANEQTSRFGRFPNINVRKAPRLSIRLMC